MQCEKKNVSIFSVILDYSISTRNLIFICKQTTTSLKNQCTKKIKILSICDLVMQCALQEVSTSNI